MTTYTGIFSSKLGVFAATLGSAIGLGNIWKVPALIGQNGGAAFLLIYILASFLLGLPLMITEIALGRNAKGSIFTVIKKNSPHTLWIVMPILALFSALFLMAFYSDVVGWVFIYVWKSLLGSFSHIGSEEASSLFSSIALTKTALIGQSVVFVLVTSILLLGINKGIEKVTKALIPLLTIILFCLALYSLTLDKAGEALYFLFYPDFSKVTGEVILIAVGLAFFKLSLGGGPMVTYGSYFRSDQNIPLTAIRVMFADLLISLIAGIAIFPAVFTYGFEITNGPSLLFITIPTMFAAIPGGNFIIILFFLLTAFATIGAMISIVEVPISMLVEKGISRTYAVLLSIGITFSLGVLATLSMTPTLSEYTFFGKNIFDLYDFLTSNILMPTVGFLFSMYLIFVIKKERIFYELSNNNSIANEGLLEMWYVIVRFVTPIIIVTVLLNGLT
ncbi:MAG: sodium-dependent transporter [Desulfovibrionaceae bacterium]